MAALRRCGALLVGPWSGLVVGPAASGGAAVVGRWAPKAGIVTAFGAQGWTTTTGSDPRGGLPLACREIRCEPVGGVAVDGSPDASAQALEDVAQERVVLQ